MFWALILEPHKEYSQIVERSFHVSMATLDLASLSDKLVQVFVRYKEKCYLLCNLIEDKKCQVPLDINFEEGTYVTFLTYGRGFVHLTGYILPYDEICSDNSEEEEVENEIEKKKERWLITNQNSLKRKTKSQEDGRKVKISKQESFDKSNDQDANSKENYGSLEEEDNDEDMEDMEQEKNENDNDNDEDEDEDEEEEEEEEKEQEHEKKEIENQQQQKQKKNHDKQYKTNGEEIKQEQQSKKQKKKTEQQMQQKTLNEAKKRIVEGGVQVEDIKIGDGALATLGKSVTVYYVARCKIGKEEKKFDSCIQGKGYKFRVGKGEVIRGWEIGVIGMKVGGKRRLTIPPNLGYGAKSISIVPANSTLTFDIELKKVN